MRSSDLACLNGFDYKPAQPVFAAEGCGERALECLVLLDTQKNFSVRANIWSRGNMMNDPKNGSIYATLRIDWQTWMNCRSTGSGIATTICVLTKRREDKVVDVDVIQVMRSFNPAAASTEKGLAYQISLGQQRKGATLRNGEFGNITILMVMHWAGGARQWTAFEIAGHICAQSVEYDTGPFTFEKRVGSKKVTEIDIIALIGFSLAGLSFLLSAALYITTKIYARHANAVLTVPLNRLNGLSSMLREEHSPSGICGKTGKPALIAITQAGLEPQGRKLHLGPVHEEHVPCSVQTGDSF
jgi:hypothetical protein